MVTALGGKQNIASVENCITRLRIDVNDVSMIDKKLLEQSGCTGSFSQQLNIYILYMAHK